MKDVRTRTVLLLGRRPSVDWGRLRDTLRSGEDFVVLSLGYPVTAGQRAAVLKAEALAAEAGAWFDALLVTSVQEVLNAVGPDDEVSVAARGRQGKYLRSALHQDEARYR
jgi:hypothetical protein